MSHELMPAFAPAANLASGAEIARRYRPSYAEFTREFLDARQPVILSGATDRWKARFRWTPRLFAERYGDMRLHANNQPYTLGGFVPQKPDGSPLTFGELVDLVMHSTNEKPAPYLRNVHIEKFLPELLADLQPIPEYLQPNWLEGPLSRPLASRLHGGGFELYIGGAGGKFPVLHYDTWHIHTFLCQVHGVKRYTLFAPEQTPFLYARGNQSQVDLERPDLEKFPLFAQATPIAFELHPGEILFVPAGWWHTTKILSPSITVSASRVNSSNWREFSHDLTVRAPSAMRPMVAAYLSTLGLYHRVRS